MKDVEQFEIFDDIEEIVSPGSWLGTAGKCCCD